MNIIIEKQGRAVQIEESFPDDSLLKSHNYTPEEMDAHGEGKTFDQILDEIGGFGKYQLIWFIIVVTGMLSGAFILYSLYYFELVPVYQCNIWDGLQFTWTTCT